MDILKIRRPGYVYKNEMKVKINVVSCLFVFLFVCVYACLCVCIGVCVSFCMSSFDMYDASCIHDIYYDVYFVHISEKSSILISSYANKYVKHRSK